MLDPSDGVFGRFDLAALCGCHTLNVCCCCCYEFHMDDKTGLVDMRFLNSYALSYNWAMKGLIGSGAGVGFECNVRKLMWGGV